MKPFQPRADRAQWRIVLDDLAAPAQTGEVITYDAIREATGCEPGHEQIDIERVKNRLLEEQGRSLAAVPGKGYMVIAGGAVVRQALEHQRKELRQTGRALRRYQKVARAELSPGEKALADEQQDTLARRYDADRRELRARNRQERLLDLVRSPKGVHVMKEESA